MPSHHPHLLREVKTIECMLRMYCAAKHSGKRPCAACGSLLEYAHKRLGKCAFGEGKPPCDQCPIHCYTKDKREQVRHVMRYAGPRMLYRHPLLTILHWADRIAWRRKAARVTSALD